MRFRTHTVWSLASLTLLVLAAGASLYAVSERLETSAVAYAPSWRGSEIQSDGDISAIALSRDGVIAVASTGLLRVDNASRLVDGGLGGLTAGLLAAGPDGAIYTVNLNTVEVFTATRERARSFRVPRPNSIAVTADNSLLIAGLSRGKLVHLVGPIGGLRASFAEVQRLVDDRAQNTFMNQGFALSGPDGTVYYTRMFSTDPKVERFSQTGRKLGEFALDGDGITHQVEMARRLLLTKNPDTVAAVQVITAAAVDQGTGHLWFSTNSQDGAANLYKYTSTGEKVAEFELSNANSTRLQFPTHLLVQNERVYGLFGGRLYRFDPDSVVKRSRPSHPSLIAALVRRFVRFRSPSPSAHAYASHLAAPNSAAPRRSCGPGLTWSCYANCTAGPVAANCGSAAQSLFSGTITLVEKTCTENPRGTGTGGIGCSISGKVCNSLEHFVNFGPVVIGCHKDTDGDGCADGDDCNANDAAYCPNCAPNCLVGSQVDMNCNGIYDEWGPECGGTPIILDLGTNGLQLTSRANGVMFDLDGNGSREQLSWTSSGEDAFLALDRNQNQTIDHGQELFGNFTPQPPSGSPNGFIALADYDLPGNGGNSDGVISEADAVFSQLLLWSDLNHNGTSEPHELSALSASEFWSISLDVREAGRRDRFGNSFRYRAKLGSLTPSAARWAYDVILVTRP